MKRYWKLGAGAALLGLAGLSQAAAAPTAAPQDEAASQNLGRDRAFLQQQQDMGDRLSRLEAVKQRYAMHYIGCNCANCVALASPDKK